MSQGAMEMFPVKTVEEAFEKAKAFPRNVTLLGGERESQKIEGFDLGNSPREYIAEKVGGKRLIMTSTNGTKAFHSVTSAAEILVGSFFNISATAERSFKRGGELLIFPSGDEKNFSLEDTVCGGMLIDRIMKLGKKAVTLTDASYSAHVLYQRFETNLVEVFRLSRHGRELIDRGHEKDLPYCAQIDITNVVPIFRDGVIKVE